MNFQYDVRPYCVRPNVRPTRTTRITVLPIVKTCQLKEICQKARLSEFSNFTSCPVINVGIFSVTQHLAEIVSIAFHKSKRHLISVEKVKKTKNFIKKPIILIS